MLPPAPVIVILLSHVLRLPRDWLCIMLPDRSHLCRRDTKSGCKMCGAGKPTGGKSSTPVWNKCEQARRSITDTIWAFGCPFSCCLHSGITPRVPPTLKPQQKQRGSNIRTYKQIKNTQFPLFDGMAFQC